MARLIARQASATLGQPIVIDNRGDAAGLITILPWINRSLTFDPPRDLAPVAHLVDTPMVLVVAANSSFRTVGDLIAEARAHRDSLNYASTGVGTISHRVMESLKLAADIDVVHVPYLGAAAALNDLKAGQVQGMFTSTASAAPMVASGGLRPLAVRTAHRSLGLLSPDRGKGWVRGCTSFRSPLS